MSPNNRATRSIAANDVANPVAHPADRRTGTASDAAVRVKSRRDSICGRSFNSSTVNRIDSRLSRQDSHEARCSSTSRCSDAVTWSSI